MFSGTRFVVKPGRFLVGDAGIYVTQVRYVKSSDGKKFVVVDGGMNHYLAASGNLGRVIKRNFPVRVLNRLNEPDHETVDVVGPLCTPLDVLARDVPMPKIRTGDSSASFNSVPTRTASSLGFLSHPTPAEVLIRNGQTNLIRRRGTYEDLHGETFARFLKMQTTEKFVVPKDEHAGPAHSSGMSSAVDGRKDALRVLGRKRDILWALSTWY